MREFIKKYGKVILISVVSLVGLALIISAISMISQHSNEIIERSKAIAEKNTLNACTCVERNIDDYTAKARAVAHKSASLNYGELHDYHTSLENNDEFSGIYDEGYFDKDGKLVRWNHPIEEGSQEGDVAVKYRNANPDKAGYIGSFSETMATATSQNGSMLIVGFYAPVTGSELIDGVVLYYLREVVEGFYSTENMHEKADFSVLCMSTGEILVGDSIVGNSQILDYLRVKVGERAPIDKVKEYLSKGESGIVSVKIGAEDYVISVGANKGTMKDIAVVELYRASALSSSSVDFINTIVAIFVLFTVIVVGVVTYFIVRHIRIKKQMFNMETIDRNLGCKNRHGFEKEVKDILEINKGTYFAVIVMQIRHYKFLLENYGASEVNNLLSYLKLCCSKTVQTEESYGYIEEDKFLLLLHAKDRKGLLERLKIYSFLASQYKGAHAFSINLKYGIYESDKSETISITQMIDYANEANNTIVKATAQNAGMIFNFYDHEVRKVRLINEDMELRMENALKNGEFQVFYQPKYNLNIKRQDGSEALVRWYDSKTKEYNRPALFMQLFESNGFIVKLDKYVYTKVCEYISYSIAHGRTVYPVSINVSRITAVQPDFIDYYVKIKRKYGISDGQIMVEFTESFAYENYETLGDIVEQLHKNGFKCSIDDFGCGYSSYRILKELPMDEIKLDKFFIERGESEHRSECIMQSVVDLAKKLGMKVTQEGVETIEDVKLLEQLGCDVIQGYYYSHPLPLTDYINFCANSKQHNIT